MKIQKVVQIDRVTGLGAGFIEINVEEKEDLYHIYRLLQRNDKCTSVTKRNVKKKKINCTLELENLEPYFDGVNLTIKGVVVSERKPVRVGSYHTFKIERNSWLKVTKAQWDSVDIAFMKDSCEMVSVSPMAVVLLTNGTGDISMIDQSCTTSMWSNTRPMDDVELFDRVMHALVSKLDLDSMEIIIVASSDASQKKFLQHLFETSKKRKSKLNLQMSKFCGIEVPVANRGHLRNILLHPTAIKKINNEHRSILELQALERFRNHMGRTSHDEDEIFLNQCHIKELLVSERVLRDSDRRKRYGELVEFIIRKKDKDLTLFSPYHPGHIYRFDGDGRDCRDIYESSSGRLSQLDLVGGFQAHMISSTWFFSWKF